MAFPLILTSHLMRGSVKNLIKPSNIRTLSSTKMLQEHKNMPQATFFPPLKETMLPKETFKNRVVFISGGGTGLGKGMATKFSELGAKVVIASRRLNVLEEAAKGVEISR